MISLSMILSLFFIPVFFLLLTGKLRTQLGKFESFGGILFGGTALLILYVANIDKYIEAITPEISPFTGTLMLISLIHLVVTLFENNEMRLDRKRISSLLILMGLIVILFTYVHTSASYLFFTLYFIFFYNLEDIGFYSRLMLLIDLTILILLQFYKNEVMPFELGILALFLVRVILFIPLILRDRIKLNFLLSQYPIIILLIDLMVRKFHIVEVNTVSFFTSSILLSGFIMLEALFSNILSIRIRLLSLSFLPILLAWAIKPFSFLSLFLLVVIALFFSFIHLNGKVIYSRDNKWVQLVPMYFFAFLISPLPGSPFFFALIDQLKVSNYSTLFFVVVSVWLIIYTFLLLAVVEGKLEDDRGQDLSINPVRVILFLIGIILVTVCFVERFYLYELLNSISFTLSFYNFSNQVKEMGFRFYIVGLPFLSLFSILVFYSLRHNDYFVGGKEAIKMRYYYFFKNIFDSQSYSAIGNIVTQSSFFILRTPVISIKKVSNNLNRVLLTIYNFFFKVSKDIDHLKVGTQFILILFILLIALLLTYGEQ